MVTVNDIKVGIINLVTGIDDVRKLKKIYQDLEEIVLSKSFKKENIKISDLGITFVSSHDDLDKLTKLEANLRQDASEPNQQEKVKKPKLSDAIVEIREGVTYQQILEEQNYKPMSYKEFRTLADEIEWEYSLDELLASLD